MSNYDETVPMQSWSIPAELGPLYMGDEHGQLVADVRRECVVVRFGVESREVKSKGAQ